MSAYHKFPIYIWYEFPDPVVPMNVSFHPRHTDELELNGMPTDFEFVGSCAEKCGADSEWESLCGQTYNIDKPIDANSGHCTVQKHKSRPGYNSLGFRCLGLRIHRAGKDETVKSLRNLQMWIRKLRYR